MDKFIILSVPRSGSTVLTRTLDKHPEIFCAGELFNTSDDIYHPEYHFRSWGLNSTSHSIQAINRLINYPNQRLRAIPHIKKFYSVNSKNEKARGFKLMYSNINSAPYLWNYLKGEQIKMIVLTRRNVFKTILSRYRKATNRVAHVAESKSEIIHFTLPASKLIKQITGLEKVNNMLTALTSQVNSINIYYEDFENWNEMIRNVQGFLLVKPIELPPVLKKIGAVRWQDEVENYNEIERLLIQHNYKEYI